jgi:molybdopterin converting factor small subunit
MSGRIKLSHVFQQLADNQGIIMVEGNTIRECLDDFIRRYPATKNWIFDKQKTLISLILLNGKTLHPKDLDIGISEGDEIYLLTMISGG